MAAAEPAPTQPQAHGTPALPPRPEEDPQIAALQAMFPDFDATILYVRVSLAYRMATDVLVRRQSVLDSVNGDQDRAIDALLGMSDPSYVSQEPERPPAVSTFHLPPTHRHANNNFARSPKRTLTRSWRAG